ncbi:hypothetical protein [uncultured Alistipes sp.]|uniref:hypothetical protein n=1 Tax=uncultured Alistipes sp. TaxID=538949 RepID=UPI0025DAF96C|nr:hypothetical protein [uncultured Alistipes sp.]
MKRILLLLCAALCTASCAVQTTYIGKAYPATDAPELFFSWDDVTRDYETMGRITAAPQFFGTLEKAQEVIEQRAREKGADAVVFEGIGRTVSEPTYTTTEHIQQNEDGSSTRTATTQRNVTVSDRLEATFLKYR